MTIRKQALGIALCLSLVGASGLPAPATAKQDAAVDAQFQAKRTADLMKLSVPRNLRGVWGERGDCADPAKRMVVTAHSIRFGAHKAEAIFFAREDGPQGQDAIDWIQEGVSSNIQYDTNRDRFYMNEMGWGYGSSTFYSRCPAKKK